MRKFKIKIEFEEPPINLVDCDCDKEIALLNNYNYGQIDILPDTENQLFRYYHDNAILLLNYYHEVMSEPAFELTNEIRAMFGHLVDYRLKTDPLRENLQKAYGHFRRLNIDAFKILCDEYDKVFSQKVTNLYKYDYRSVAANYLRTYLELYFEARNLYLDAQNNESLGKNSNNVYEYYFKALVAYIKLKNYYIKNKEVVEKRKRKSITFKTLSVLTSLALSVITASCFW